MIAIAIILFLFFAVFIL
ncbi:hypothetical protein [Candidatus Francisella endociliophora]